ncbi:hypothetical protein HDU98_007273, partial [Podochytrium sp. JEL0797]
MDGVVLVVVPVKRKKRIIELHSSTLRRVGNDSTNARKQPQHAINARIETLPSSELAAVRRHFAVAWVQAK